MKQLTIDTGVQEFEINGSGVLRFNPSDPNVYNRFFAAETTLTELDAEAQKRMEQIEADFPDDRRQGVQQIRHHTPSVACDRRKVHAMQDLVKVVTRAKNAV